MHGCDGIPIAHPPPQFHESDERPGDEIKSKLAARRTNLVENDNKKTESKVSIKPTTVPDNDNDFLEVTNKIDFLDRENSILNFFASSDVDKNIQNTKLTIEKGTNEKLKKTLKKNILTDDVKSSIFDLITQDALKKWLNGYEIVELKKGVQEIDNKILILDTEIAKLETEKKTKEDEKVALENTVPNYNKGEGLKKLTFKGQETFNTSHKEIKAQIKSKSDAIANKKNTKHALNEDKNNKELLIKAKENPPTTKPPTTKTSTTKTTAVTEMINQALKKSQKKGDDDDDNPWEEDDDKSSGKLFKQKAPTNSAMAALTQSIADQLKEKEKVKEKGKTIVTKLDESTKNLFTTTPPTDVSEIYTKYDKMLSVKLPREAVEQRMRTDKLLTDAQINKYINEHFPNKATEKSDGKNKSKRNRKSNKQKNRVGLLLIKAQNQRSLHRKTKAVIDNGLSFIKAHQRSPKKSKKATLKSKKQRKKSRKN